MLRALAFALVLAACGGKKPPPADNTGTGAPPPAGAACIKTGCSGTVCADEGNDVITTCEFKPEYACYDKASCERQADGTCAWTQSPELAACLANPPAP